MDFLIATLSVMLCLALFGGGFLLGWKIRGAREPSVKNPGEEETRRMAAEEEAYQKMMGYSVETAYGLNGNGRIET